MKRLGAIALASVLVAAAAAPQQRILKVPDVKYVPSPDSVVEAMLAIAHVNANDVVYDLGSGDGRIPITAAQRYGAHGVGVEIDRQLVAIANDNAKKAGVADRVVFLNQDLFTTDFSAATVVTLFLMPKVNAALMPKLKAMRPGTRIVSHMWDMGAEWPPDAAEDVSGLMIYLWTIK
jgi:16S rRNA G966 N2-methylase RsmD